MKKILLGLIFLFIDVLANAQNGLENIIVEKYYISDENDTTVNFDGGILPPGSVTYRIYADLLPGYEFQAAYGVSGSPGLGTTGHELRLATTTSFFNNEDRGDITAAYTKAQAANNTVMLDSWLSVGGACVNNFGVMKSDDNGISNVVNSDGVLHNSDPLAGIPLTSQDGILANTTGDTLDVTFVGITSEVEVFNAATQGNLFSTYNGSWASLIGSHGPTPGNKVLIAQITTDGIFSFELNIQVGTPSGGVQNFVARNPVGNEISIPSLIYQNIPEMRINLKAFIEGFYLGGGLMNASIDPVGQPNDADTLTLQLAEVAAPNTISISTPSILHTNGTALYKFSRSMEGNSYYLVLRHRNAIETWSANPVVLAANMKYDFSNAVNKAYGGNLSNLQDGNFGIFSGDISDAGSAAVGLQDGVMESQDYSDMENAVSITLQGYIPQDITGDGVVESADYSIEENNVSFVIFALKP